MDIFDYVAQSNPSSAMSVCRNYGYRLQGGREGLSHGLRQLVSKEGESAMRDILNAHPDKELFIEVYGQRVPQYQPPIQQGYFNAIGDGVTSSDKLVNQTNIFLMASALLLATAIIVSAKR